MSSMEAAMTMSRDEIFEHIQNHPIAGPVIRTREKLLGLLSGLKKTSPSKECKQPVDSKAKHTHQPNAQL